MHGLTGKKLISCAKNATANLLSLFLKQEQISSDLPVFFSKRMMTRIRHSVQRIFRKKEEPVLRSKGTAFLMSLLQTKRWIGLVPKSFIQESLLKHKETMLSDPPLVSPETHQLLFQLATEFGRGVVIKGKVPLPTTKATFESNRESGGYLKTLRPIQGRKEESISMPVQGTDNDLDLIPILRELYGELHCRYLYDEFNPHVNYRFVNEDKPGFLSLHCACHKDQLVDPRMINLEKWVNNLEKKIMDVKPVAIPEPLKVRVITKGNAFSYLLKMVQTGMTEHLNSLPIFKVTGGVTVEEAVLTLQDKIKERSDLFFISGDYDAATDNLPLEVIQTVMRGILSSARNNIRSTWMRKLFTDLVDLDILPHLIHYEKEVVSQKRGQLMGSLLSFPVLCLVNYATVLLARNEPFSNRQRRKEKLPDLFTEPDILVNGDDLLFVDTSIRYSTWKMAVASFGLLLSVGKNYISRGFGTINSRLLLRDRVLPVLRFGDLKSKESNVLEKWSSFCSQSNNAPELENCYRFFIYRMAEELKRTNVSLFLPQCFGGPLPNRLFEFVPERLKSQIQIEFALFHLYKFGRSHQRKIHLIGKQDPTQVPVSWEITEKVKTPTRLWVTLPKSFHKWISDNDLEPEKMKIENLFLTCKDLDWYTIPDDQLLNFRIKDQTRRLVLGNLRRVQHGRVGVLAPAVNTVKGLCNFAIMVGLDVRRVIVAGFRGHRRVADTVLKRPSELRGILEEPEDST